MKTKTAVNAIACPPGALPGGLTRTRFFDGMFLTQADLENEQRFWRIKRRLTNRALGEGVVWGLRLSWNPNRHAFALSPGYALDCCGNDLVVECPVEVSERELWERAELSLRNTTSGIRPARPAIHSHDDQLDHQKARGETRHACVVLQYVECPEDARPVHRDACAGLSGGCEASRIRETTRLMLVPPKPALSPSPPEMFWDELKEFYDRLGTIDPAIRDALFPPQAQPPPPQPQSGKLPVHVHVRIPNSTGGTVHADLQPEIGTVVRHSPLPMVATQAYGPARTGVVTFELTPSPTWGFSDGEVRDRSRVVETVTPPLAMSMYWALDVAVAAGATAETRFEFQVHDLGIQESFGAGAWGRATFVITGLARVSESNGQVQVTVDDLEVAVKTATVIEGGEKRSCFEDVFPWGWATDSSDGSRIARVLVLAAMYTWMSELIQRGASQGWRTIASFLYAAVWLGFFGVFPFANVEEQYRRELVGLLVRLYERWCAGFAYPGPRCGDDHHGVYLGCVELTANGAIVGFDMWEGRRYVLTGPLLTHWAGLFGIAPVDVIVGRFAEAICCLAGQPRIVLPPLRTEDPADERVIEKKNGFDIGAKVHVGNFASIEEFGRDKAAPVKWVDAAALAPRVMEMFLGRDTGGPRETLAIRVPNGGSLAIAVPARAGGAVRGRLHDDVNGLYRRGETRVSPSARAPLTDLTVEIARGVPASALAAPGVPPAAAELAERMGKRGVTVAHLAEGGVEPALSRIGATGAEREKLREAAELLVDRAEVAVDGVATVVARAAGPGVRREKLTDPALVEKTTEALKKMFEGKVGREVVAAAARRAANG